MMQRYMPYTNNNSLIRRESEMRNLVIGTLVFMMFLFVGCGSEPAGDSQPGAAVEDYASLVAALESAGAAVESGDPVLQPFFTPEGQIITVNGQAVQLFEYATAAEAAAEAELVSADGSSVGTSIMAWIDTPHFYQGGRLIVLYIGSDAAALSLLESVLGPQFAGG